MPEDRFVFESVLWQPYLWERIMTEAKSGDRVKVHYTGTLDDGRQFDSSRSREPLEFVIGEGNLIPGFEQAVVGMGPGENRVVNIPATEAYGQPQTELVRSIPRSDMPDHIELSQGLVLNAQSPDGKVLHFTVVEFDEGTVTLDGNHPLAGEDLTFDIELVEVVSA
jgi:FKBP-type peptidyl-prolyl cis-trans isomerase 2